MLSCFNCGKDFTPGEPGGKHDHGNENCDTCWHKLYETKEEDI
jgi:hypothetical protein